MAEEKETKENGIAWNIIDAIKAKLKEKAKDYGALEKLAEENHDLAEFINDIDQLISNMAWHYLAKITKTNERR